MCLLFPWTATVLIIKLLIIPYERNCNVAFRMVIKTEIDGTYWRYAHYSDSRPLTWTAWSIQSTNVTSRKINDFQFINKEMFELVMSSILFIFVDTLWRIDYHSLLKAIIHKRSEISRTLIEVQYEICALVDCH